MSSFSWLDFSDYERRQALQVIDLFRENETVDELGLGVIRDTLSDLLFPATSTIQTRPRYFLFLPWLLRTLESSRISSKVAAEKSRLLQGKLRNGLVNGGEELGVIGYLAGLDVKRLPSSVYWSGLRTLRILRVSGSEYEYYRHLSPFKPSRSVTLKSDDGEPVSTALAPDWDLSLPDPPNDFPEKVTFQLTVEESDYLADRIALTGPQSFLHVLIQTGQPIEDGHLLPWQHPAAQHLPEPLGSRFAHARNFSESMQGARLLYNVILSCQTRRDDLAEKYRAMLSDWWTSLQAARSTLIAWDRQAFWRILYEAGGRVTVPCRTFVDEWLDLLFAGSELSHITDSQRAHSLITVREQQLKGKRARIGNPRAGELWSGASGTIQLDYRWNRPVRALVNDVLNARTEAVHA